MKPIRETTEAVNELEPWAHSGDLLTTLTRLAGRAQDVVPELVGVSIARLDEGLTFTLVATAEELAVLDGVQYLAGGPCVEGAQAGRIREFDTDDVLDEERWQLFAQATAARSVWNTLTLPVLADGRVAGTVNLYAASPGAFRGHHDELAEIFGAWAAGAVANADLSFATRREAQAAPQRLRDQSVIDMATGILSAQLGIGVDAAEGHLRDAAVRAGVTAVALARNIIRARGSEDPDAG